MEKILRHILHSMTHSLCDLETSTDPVNFCWLPNYPFLCHSLLVQKVVKGGPRTSCLSLDHFLHAGGACLFLPSKNLAVNPLPLPCGFLLLFYITFSGKSFGTPCCQQRCRKPFLQIHKGDHFLRRSIKQRFGKHLRHLFA